MPGPGEDLLFGQEGIPSFEAGFGFSEAEGLPYSLCTCLGLVTAIFHALCQHDPNGPRVPSILYSLSLTEGCGVMMVTF